MNWGYKILIVIILFITGMLGMVMCAMRQTNDMVDHHYYQKELAYQEIIDAQKNLLEKNSDLLVTQNDQELLITLPSGTFENFEKGSVECLKPDMASKDVLFDLQPGGDNQYSIPKNKLSAGIYNIRIQWISGGTPYYKQESIHLL